MFLTIDHVCFPVLCSDAQAASPQEIVKQISLKLNPGAQVSEHIHSGTRGSPKSNAQGGREGDPERGTRALLRRAAGTAFGSYQFNRLYMLALPAPTHARAPAAIEVRPILDPETLSRHPDPGINRRSSYGGHGAWGYGAWCDGALVAVCWVWSSERCGNGIVRLAPRERALVDIYTRPEFRGREIGPALIACAAADATRAGCTSLFAWIWWSNAASIRAFEKSGWVYRDFVFSLRLLGRTLTGSWARKPSG